MSVVDMFSSMFLRLVYCHTLLHYFDMLLCFEASTNKKTGRTFLAHFLLRKMLNSRCIHGDLSQPARNEIIHDFKKKEFPILVIF